MGIRFIEVTVCAHKALFLIAQTCRDRSLHSLHSVNPRPFVHLASAALLIALGCTGSINGGFSEAPGDLPRPGPPAEEDSPEPGQCASSNVSLTPRVTPFQRLTRTEYNNTVRDLLGDTSQPASTFASDDGVIGGAFASNAGVAASRLIVTEYMEAAEAVAKSAMGRLDTLLPCRPSVDGEDNCARQFIEQLGLRAYRRPLTSVETDRYFTLYRSMRLSSYDFSNGIRVLIQAMLFSVTVLHLARRSRREPSLWARTIDSI